MAEGVNLIQRFYDEILGAGDLDKLSELVTDDVIEHEQMPGQASGIEGVRQFAETMGAAFSDIKATLGPTLESDDLASAHVTLTGKHTGEFMGVPATDKSFEIES